MKRNYLYLEYKQIIKKLRAASPHILISSDFIVGFPGESDSDHQKTLKAIQEIDFDYSFSFIYSPRPGTPAAYLEDRTDSSVKKLRLKEIQDLIALQGKRHTQNMLNTQQRILVSEQIGVNKYKGRSDNNRIVEIEAPENIINKLINVKIVDVSKKNLTGILN